MNIDPLCMNDALYIGLISGTSVDGIDGALINVSDNNIQLVGTYSQPIPESIRQLVYSLATPSEDEINKIRLLDQQLGDLLSQTSLALCEKYHIKPEQIKAIGNHGQTIRHYPPSLEGQGFSLQVGDPNIIAEKTGITTIADFRRRDIAAGGHGAPLAPSFHNEVFRSSEADRIILNTGGIANITYLPANGEAIGFDTGPANGLMDQWCQRHLNQPYDNNGDWAASGTTHQGLLKAFLDHPYFSQAIPKSTGREDFNIEWVDSLIENLNEKIAPEDIQATLLSLTCLTITQSINELTPHNSEVYICGGGAHNRTLCQALRDALHPRLFASTDDLGISPDWVEAMAFAWMASQTMNHLSSNLTSVTGANREVILGGIYQGRL